MSRGGCVYLPIYLKEYRGGQNFQTLANGNLDCSKRVAKFSIFFIIIIVIVIVIVIILIIVIIVMGQS